MALTPRAAAAALLLALGATLGAFLAHRITHPTPVHIPEVAAPAVTQSDGSTLLARQPASPRTPAAKPRAQLPAGATLERKVDLTVKPDEPGSAAQVELSLVRMPDQTRRVVAYSDNAVVGGIDVPIEPVFAAPEAKRWAAGLYVNPLDRRQAGVFFDSDVGRLRLGLEVGRGVRGEAEARVKVGVTF